MKTRTSFIRTMTLSDGIAGSQEPRLSWVRRAGRAVSGRVGLVIFMKKALYWVKVESVVCFIGGSQGFKRDCWTCGGRLQALYYLIRPKTCVYWRIVLDYVLQITSCTWTSSNSASLYNRCVSHAASTLNVALICRVL